MWQAKGVMWNQLIPYDREPLVFFKLHLNLKCSAKLRDLFINSINVFNLISSYTKPIFRDKGLKQIKNKLTNKIDCVLEKGNSNEVH